MKLQSFFDLYEIIPRDHDMVHSSSSLAKGILPEAQSHMRNKIRIDQGIAMATT